MRTRSFITLVLLLVARSAFAFPELIRYNYVNCTSCHVSPTGGGVLTQYGRETSRDVLSTWGADQEVRPAYFINSPEWLALGGDYRSVYTYVNTPGYEYATPGTRSYVAGQYYFMQADIEAAATYKKFTLDASVGYQDPLVSDSWTDHLISRRHYLMFHFTDEIALRGGRFFPAYGIYTPNHSLVVRSLLDIESPEQVGQGESYNLEFSYLGDTYNVTATGVFGRPDDPKSQREKGATLVLARSILDHYKVGLNYLYGTQDFEHRNVFGFHGILGFTQQLYLLSETDFQAKSISDQTSTQWGFAQVNRFGYEPVRGVNLILNQEFSRLDFKSEYSIVERYGTGVVWFPRPHLEFSLEYQRRLDRAQYSAFYNYAYFLWHFYL